MAVNSPGGRGANLKGCDPGRGHFEGIVPCGGGGGGGTMKVLIPLGDVTIPLGGGGGHTIGFIADIHLNNPRGGESEDRIRPGGGMGQILRSDPSEATSENQIPGGRYATLGFRSLRRRGSASWDPLRI